MKNATQTILALVICFFSLQSAKAATGDITGQIIEKESKMPVAFAEVTLNNGTTTTVITANEYGHYSANHLPTGKYQVTVKYDNHTVEMNAIHIKDSYTTGINLIVSGSESTVETDKTKNDKTEGALRQHQDNIFDMIVKPTQGPVKAPLANNDTDTTTILIG